MTGGAGYIGAHSIVELYKAGYKPIAIDNFSKSDKTLLNGIEKIIEAPLPFYEGDCADYDFLKSVFDTEKDIGGVMHFAAYKSVSESVEEPLDYYINNVGSLTTLLKTMTDFEIQDLVYSSSCTVYGQPDQIPVPEDAEFKKAESPYGTTKQICEQILKDVYLAGSKFRTVSLRYFNPIGAHPSGLIGEIPLGVPNNLVPYITQTAAGVREKLTIFGMDYDTHDGTCVRDYIHVTDLAIAHVKALDYIHNVSNDTLHKVFNLGMGQGVTVLDIVKKFEVITGKKLNYHMGNRRPGDVEKIFAKTDLSNNELNWKTQYSIDEALLHAWNWEKILRRR